MPLRLNLRPPPTQERCWFLRRATDEQLTVLIVPISIPLRVYSENSIDVADHIDPCKVPKRAFARGGDGAYAYIRPAGGDSRA